MKMNEQDFPAALEMNGWIFKEWCGTCSRQKKAKFRNSNFPRKEVVINVNKKMFKILEGGLTILRYTSFIHLDAILKSL